jgi:hypothetical protein
MSKIEVNAIEPQSGTTLTVGASGDTVTVPSGVTFDASNATTTLPSNVVTTTGTQTLTNKTIDASQLTDSTISLAKLSATGTKDATTFLRGDNSFAEAGGGKVLQVVSTTKTDTFSITSTSFADITGLSVSITPSSASNKIMVFVDCYIGGPASSSTQSMTRLMRDSTAICVGASAGSRTQASSESGLDSVNHVEPVAINFLDTPSTTSAITYKVQMRVTGGTHYVNRTSNDDDGDYNSRVASTITVMEIAG